MLYLSFFHSYFIDTHTKAKVQDCENLESDFLKCFLMCLFLFHRWKAIQLPLGRLREKICALWWTLQTSAHSHRRKEVCVSCVWPSFHAKRPLDQACAPSHDCQAVRRMGHWRLWPEQNGFLTGSINTVSLSLPQCTHTCLKLDQTSGLDHSLTSGQYSTFQGEK